MELLCYGVERNSSKGGSEPTTIHDLDIIMTMTMGTRRDMYIQPASYISFVYPLRSNLYYDTQ